METSNNTACETKNNCTASKTNDNKTACETKSNCTASETNNEFKYPSFLLCPPSTYEERIANNIWMRELPEEDMKPDHKKAMKQFTDFYQAIASKSLAYLLPAPSDVPLQDLVFTANIGIVLSHLLPKRKVAIVSNFTSEPRTGETEYGLKFFKSMGYETFVPETKFEGEADLKYLHDNVYIGGYGMRSELETYKWMEKNFDMKIICVQMTEEYLYHLDCSIFPLTPKKILICKSLYEDEELKALSEVVELIDVECEMAFSGICNSVRIGKTIFNADNRKILKEGSDELKDEIAKNEFLNKVVAENDLEVQYVELDEFTKSGALLSCMVLHMNRDNY